MFIDKCESVLGSKVFTIILGPVPNPPKDGALYPNLYPGGHLLERIIVLICTVGIYKSRNSIHLMDPSG